MLKVLDSDDLRIAAPFILEVGDRMGILPKRPLAAEPERDRDRDQDAVLGQMIRMAMDKSVRYSMPLPDSIIEQLHWIHDYTQEVLEACEADGPEAAEASTEGRES